MTRFLASLCSATLALASFSMALTPAPIFASDDYYDYYGDATKCANSADCNSGGDSYCTTNGASACANNSVRKNCLCNGQSPSKTCGCG